MNKTEWSSRLSGEKRFYSRLSPYDEIIQRIARENNLDWRLVVSVVSTESSFEKSAVSPAGAKGLMQIMPAVAQEQGVTRIYHPEENIRAGVRHLGSLFARVGGRTERDQLKLALAAYNAGLGHLRDAQRIVVRQNGDPFSWDDVAEALLLLEDPLIYEVSVHGYCRGSETRTYVKRVVGLYDHHRENVHIRALPTDPRDNV